MHIQYEDRRQMFCLTTDNTKYVFQVIQNKYLIHKYYGRKREYADLEYRVEALGFSPTIPDEMNSRFSLNDSPLEFSYFDSGDYRPTQLRIKGMSGADSTFFSYESYEILKGRRKIEGLPFARTSEETETLAIYLSDKVNKARLILYYTVYPKHDIITRYFVLENNGDSDIKLEKAMSICLDLPSHEYDTLTLHGCSAMECNVQRAPLMYGNYSVTSRRGASSHNFNPFLAVVSKDTTEEAGDVYAFNFIFSGSFLDEIEVDPQGNTRVAVGLGSENFAYTISSGERFYSPEGVMLYTADGIGAMSRKFHSFIRDCILPEEVRERRPVVLNTWEACYFDINQDIIMDFAEEAAKYGMDTVVVDDGWFGHRDDDTSSLGDWYPDLNKFPEGLKVFASMVKEKGVNFGIWVEPEMINPDSELYQEHPDWCLNCKGRTPTLSRNQLLLDLCNPEVLEYLKKTFHDAFTGVDIDYIKWDFNRNPSEAGSPYLPDKQQDEVWYRYYLGLYDLFYWFRKEFPHVLFESCSGGGGRYDLGMMAVSHQIWTSDNTTAKDRSRIQSGALLAYPACVMSCHVSATNEKEEPQDTAEEHDIYDYKYKVALAGILGYELNILKTSHEVKEQIQEQIAFYRTVEPLIKQGHLFRLVSPFENTEEVNAYYYADKEENADEILLTYLQNYPYQKREISWHMELTPQKVHNLKVIAADVNARYEDKLTGKVYSGKELRAGILVRMSEKSESSEMYHFCKMRP